MVLQYFGAHHAVSAYPSEPRSPDGLALESLSGSTRSWNERLRITYGFADLNHYGNDDTSSITHIQ